MGGSGVSGAVGAVGELPPPEPAAPPLLIFTFEPLMEMPSDYLARMAARHDALAREKALRPNELAH